MSREKKHSISNWLYNRAFFTRFYERKAGRFSAEFFWDDVCARFLERIPHKGNLLEIGAGPGNLAAKILEHRPDVHIIITDYSPRMLDLARINVGKTACGDRAEFAIANAMDLSGFTGRIIDGIYCLGAAKHFPDPAACLLQAKDLLTEGGIMYFSDSCQDGMLKGMKKIIKQIKLPLLLSLFLGPLIYLGLKKESPATTQVQSWAETFGHYGTLDIQFFLDNSIFTLIYQKKDREKGSETIPPRIEDIKT
jgi:ubiquinone/menaquinone biosynthesis C-methylase UbiE